MYEFQCKTCQRAYTVPLDPHNDDLSHQKCPDGHDMDRVFSFQLGHIDWVNGGFHGDEINLGLGRHFNSARERDNYAAAHGYVKQDKYGGDIVDNSSYDRRAKMKARAEKRAKEKSNG